MRYRLPPESGPGLASGTPSAPWYFCIEANKSHSHDSECRDAVSRLSPWVPPCEASCGLNRGLTQGSNMIKKIILATAVTAVALSFASTASFAKKGGKA